MKIENRANSLDKSNLDTKPLETGKQKKNVGQQSKIPQWIYLDLDFC